jgi:N-methylhydantoinase B
MRRGSGGRGLHPGGDGLVREYELLSDASVSILSERRRFEPYGLKGGHNGAPGQNSLFRNGVWEILPSKTNIECRKGELLRVLTPGGGGYGR